MPWLQALERLVRRHEAEIVEDLVPETRVEQVQDRVLGAAEVEVDRQPVAFPVRVPGPLPVARIDEAQVVPARPGPLRHRVALARGRLAGHRIGRVDPVRDRRQRTLAGARRLVGVDLREHERQLVRLEHADGAVRQLQERERFAPVALPAEQPVAQLVVDLALADALRLDPGGHPLLGLGDAEAVEEAAVDRGTVADVGLAREVGGRLHRPHDRQAVDLGELPVALVLPGHRHDRAGSVAHHHVVGDPDRDPLAVGRVAAVGTGEDAGLLLRGLAIAVALGGGFGPVGRDGLAGAGRRELVDPGVLGADHHVGRPEHGVRPGREDPQLAPGADDGEVDLGALAAADPVALEVLDRFGPVEALEVGKEALGVGGDPQHPLLHRLADHRVAADLALAVGDLLVGEDGAQFRAPVHRNLRLVRQPLAVEQGKDPLGPAVVLGMGRRDLALPVVAEPEHLELALEGLDVPPRGDRRVGSRAHRVVLRRQAESVPTHRVQHVEAAHPLVARQDVGRRVPFGMADV